MTTQEVDFDKQFIICPFGCGVMIERGIVNVTLHSLSCKQSQVVGSLPINFEPTHVGSYYCKDGFLVYDEIKL